MPRATKGAAAPSARQLRRERRDAIVSQEMEKAVEKKRGTKAAAKASLPPSEDEDIRQLERVSRHHSRKAVAVRTNPPVVATPREGRHGKKKKQQGKKTTAAAAREGRGEKDGQGKEDGGMRNDKESLLGDSDSGDEEESESDEDSSDADSSDDDSSDDDSSDDDSSEDDDEEGEERNQPVVPVKSPSTRKQRKKGKEEVDQLVQKDLQRFVPGDGGLPYLKLEAWKRLPFPRPDLFQGMTFYSPPSILRPLVYQHIQMGGGCVHLTFEGDPRDIIFLARDDFRPSRSNREWACYRYSWVYDSVEEGHLKPFDAYRVLDYMSSRAIERAEKSDFLEKSSRTNEAWSEEEDRALIRWLEDNPRLSMSTVRTWEEFLRTKPTFVLNGREYPVNRTPEACRLRSRRNLRESMEMANEHRGSNDALTAKLKRIWTPEEDAIISGFYGEKLQEMDVKSVNKLLMDNEPWNELLSRNIVLSDGTPFSRTVVSCRVHFRRLLQRSPEILDPSLRGGNWVAKKYTRFRKWSPEEDDAMLSYCLENGVGDVYRLEVWQEFAKKQHMLGDGSIMDRDPRPLVNHAREIKLQSRVNKLRSVMPMEFFVSSQGSIQNSPPSASLVQRGVGHSLSPGMHAQFQHPHDAHQSHQPGHSAEERNLQQSRPPAQRLEYSPQFHHHHEQQPQHAHHRAAPQPSGHSQPQQSPPPRSSYPPPPPPPQPTTHPASTQQQQYTGVRQLEYGLLEDMVEPPSKRHKQAHFGLSYPDISQEDKMKILAPPMIDFLRREDPDHEISAEELDSLCFDVLYIHSGDLHQSLAFAYGKKTRSWTLQEDEEVVQGQVPAGRSQEEMLQRSQYLEQISA